jgi:hypothetical protein
MVTATLKGRVATGIATEMKPTRAQRMALSRLKGLKKKLRQRNAKISMSELVKK